MEGVQGGNVVNESVSKPAFRWARDCSAVARRVLLASALDAAAAPGLLEPWSLAEVVVPATAPETVALLWGLLVAVRGLEFAPDCEPDEEGAAPQMWQFELPTLELVGLEARLNAVEGRRRSIIVKDRFLRWDALPGVLSGDSVDSKSTYLKSVVVGLRRWRQLNPAVPSQEDLMRPAW